MAYLLHMWYVLGIISGICMACSCYICSKPLWNMRGMSFVYLLCLLAYGRAFLWHIHLTSMACLWPVYGVPLQYLQIVYLWHVYSVCLWYIYGYFLKFSKAQENSKKMLKTSKKHCKTRALTTSHSQKLPTSPGLIAKATDIAEAPWRAIGLVLSPFALLGGNGWGPGAPREAWKDGIQGGAP